MKFLFVTLLVLFSTYSAIGQTPHKINLASPFEKVDYAFDGANNQVNVQILLREATKDDSAGQRVKFKITQFNIASDKRTGSIPLDNDSDANGQMQYNFVVLISNNDIAPNPAPAPSPGLYRLSRNWKSFTFSVDYEYEEERESTPPPDPSKPLTKKQKSATFLVLRNIVDPIGSKSVKSKISTPIWMGGKKVVVPIEITGEDVYVDVSLRDNKEKQVASGGALFGHAITKVPVPLDVDITSNIVDGEQYTVIISSSRPDIAFSDPRLNSVTLSVSQEYQIDDANSPGFKNLNVTSNSENVVLTVLTTTSGDLTLNFDNGTTVKATDSNNTHTFTLRPADLSGFPDGPVPIFFTGASTNKLPLADSKKRYALNKDTSIRVVGNSTLTLDDKKVLHFLYSLSREIENEVNINGSTVNVTGTALKAADGTLLKAADGSFKYEAKIDLNASDKLTILQNAVASSPAKTAQISFTIFAFSDAPPKNGEKKIRLAVGGFILDTLVAGNPASVAQAMQTASTQVIAKKDDEARATLKQALGVTAAVPTSDEQQTIDAIMTYLKDKNKPAGKSKAIAIVSVVGRIAAGYFGIPIPAPGTTPAPVAPGTTPPPVAPPQ